MKNRMPYHESLIKFLEITESELVEMFTGKVNFTPRFRIEAAVLLEHMKITKIPEKELYPTAVRLLSFYTNFLIRRETLINEASPINENEKENLEKIFMDAVEDIAGR